MIYLILLLKFLSPSSHNSLFLRVCPGSELRGKVRGIKSGFFIMTMGDHLSHQYQCCLFDIVHSGSLGKCPHRAQIIFFLRPGNFIAKCGGRIFAVSPCNQPSAQFFQHTGTQVDGHGSLVRCKALYTFFLWYRCPSLHSGDDQGLGNSGDSKFQISELLPAPKQALTPGQLS